MKDNKTLQSNSQPYFPHSRPLIGCLVGELKHGGDQSWVQQRTRAARERGINLMTFVVGALHSPRGFDAQRNVLYELVSANRLDGLLINSGVSHFSSPEELTRFFARYVPLPMIGDGWVMKGSPSVVWDNSTGMQEVMQHLIEEHGYRRIAYIRGPAHHAAAQTRYQVYAYSLREHHIPFDSTLIASGDFQRPSGKAAICQLLDERQIDPFTDLEAIVAANDEMAIGALEELRARGIRVPHDVALVGFDDEKQAQYTLPPLTTVRTPRADTILPALFGVLETLLQGESVSAQIVLPTRLIVRHSCGCQFRAVRQARSAATRDQRGGTPGESFEQAIAARRKSLLAELGDAVEFFEAHLPVNWKDRLVDAAVAEISRRTSGSLLPVLEEVLTQVIMIDGNVGSWQNVLSIVRRYMLSCLNAEDDLSHAEEVLGQARVLIGEMAQLAQGEQRLQLEEQDELLNEIAQSLSVSFDVDELMDVLTQELPRIDITRGYIILYEDPAAPAAWSRLIMAYNASGRMELPPGGVRFPSWQILPDEFLPQEQPYSLVIEPLHFRDEQIGLFVVEGGPQRGDINDTLRALISSALKRSLLLQEQKRAYAEIQSLNERLQEENRRMSLELENIRGLLEGKPKTLRWRNRKVLLDFLRRSEDMSVPEISDSIGLSRTTVRKLLTYYIDRNLVLPGGKGESTNEGGKKPDLFIFHARAGYVIALQLFEDSVYTTLFDLQLHLLHDVTLPIRTDAPVGIIVTTVCDSIETVLVSESLDLTQVIGIALGVPGIVNHAEGIVCTASRFPAWGRNIPLVTLLQETLQQRVPLYIDHPIRFQTYAEKAVGLAKEYKNIVVIEGGASLYAGIFVKNELKRGVHHLAGEIGHIVINPNDRDVCYCGKRGCFEQMVSTTRLGEAAIAKRQEFPDSPLFDGNTPEPPVPKQIFAAANSGDPLACTVMNEVVHWFAIGLSNLLLIHDPEAIIFHGIYAGAGEYFLQHLRQELQHQTPIQNGQPVEIILSPLGRERGVLGGAAYVVAEYFNNHDLYRTES